MNLAAGFLDFGPLTIAAAATMTFAAAFGRGMTGFGMAIILVPLLGLLLLPQEAVVMGVLLQLLIGPLDLQQTLDEAEKRSAIPIGLIAMLLTPLGMWLLTATPAPMARLLITGAAVAAFVAVILPKSTKTTQPGPIAIAMTGAASGLMTGFAAMPGPPVVPFYLRRQVEPRVARASMMTIFFLAAIAGTFAAFWTGIATPRLLLLSVLLFAPMWLGNQLGRRQFGRLAPHIWQGMVAAILGVAAISALLRAF